MRTTPENWKTSKARVQRATRPWRGSGATPHLGVQRGMSSGTKEKCNFIVNSRSLDLLSYNKHI